MAKSVAVIATATINADRRGSVPNIVKAWSIRLNSHEKDGCIDRVLSIQPSFQYIANGN